MNYYSLLGVDSSAGQKQIKTAFRKRSREFHPDLNPDNPAAEEKFKEINEAYSILSDPEKRRQYDQPARSSGGRPFGLNLDDLFGQFFGGRPPAPPPARPSSPPTHEKTINFQLPLSKLMGKEPLVTYIRFNEEVVCATCKGVGGDEITPCQKCNGTGHIQQIKQGQNIVITNSHPCYDCGAAGRTIKSPCTECEGMGTVVNTRRYEVVLNCKEVEG